MASRKWRLGWYYVARSRTGSRKAPPCFDKFRMGCAPSGGHGSDSELAQVGLGQARSDHSCLRVRTRVIEPKVVRRRP